MKLRISLSFCLLVIFSSSILSFAEGFQKYSQEVSFAKMMLECSKEKVLPPMKGFGALYICTLGDANTIKWFVSEKPNTGKVLNIGMLWNDWKSNEGHGIHSDLQEAKEALAFLIDMYAPTRKKEIEKAFWGSQSDEFSTSDFLIYYTHKAGLKKDERLIVLEEN
jgi:hypothetical protein